MELLVKIVIDFKRQTIFIKRSISDVSRVLSSPLATTNQTFSTNNKTATSQSFGMVPLTTKPDFTCSKSTIKTPKTLEQNMNSFWS